MGSGCDDGLQGRDCQLSLLQDAGGRNIIATPSRLTILSQLLMQCDYNHD